MMSKGYKGIIKGINFEINPFIKIPGISTFTFLLIFIQPISGLTGYSWTSVYSYLIPSGS
jgi:hypothetical protein